jgi:hypothetical protein
MGCGTSSPADVAEAKPKAGDWVAFEEALEWVFTSIDADGNGRITLQELATVDPNAPASMEKMDTDKDQLVSLAEWNDYFHEASGGDVARAQALLQPYKQACP